MSEQRTIAGLAVGGDAPLLLIAGPCVIESREQCVDIAGRLKELCADRPINLVFKASYDKANRTSVTSFRGPGLDEGLATLAEVAGQLGLPVTSDIHEPAHAAPAGAVLDILQVPAFLCRQTDLLVAAGQTGKAVNIKKGQFVAPGDMGPAVEKVRSTGNDAVLLTDRGASFGYNRLVSDFRAVPQMQALGCPVVFDATHSAQEPGGGGTVTSGQRWAGPLLAKCAMAAGADGLFIETHPDPENAKSDAAVQLPLNELEGLLDTCLAIREAVRTR